MKKIIAIISILFLGLTIWYLGIKEYDYQITFKVTTSPASLYYEVKGLKLWGKNEKKENVTLREAIEFNHVNQEINKQNESFILDWNFKKVNDTITKVVVGVISKEHSINNRLKVITGSSTLMNGVRDEMIQFRKIFLDFSKKYKVEINGEEKIPGMEYVYIQMKSKRSDKAQVMINNNDFLYPKIIENNLKRGGYPLVKVNKWDDKSDRITFEFGFPILHQDTIPELNGLKYKHTSSQKVLKATYYGNYRNSDQAWFKLLEYAKNHNIKVERSPLEIFYNNPMQGGNELDWKTEIFLPIKD